MSLAFLFLMEEILEIRGCSFSSTTGGEDRELTVSFLFSNLMFLMRDSSIIWVCRLVLLVLVTKAEDCKTSLFS